MSTYGSVRRLAARLARRSRLLPILEYAAFAKSLATSYRRNTDFLRRSRGVYIPPPAWIAYDAYNNLNYERICEEGMAQAGVIASYIRVHQDGSANPLNVLEWGCGPGRIIQHLPTLVGSTTARYHGSDYNQTTIAWCQGNIKVATFALNGLTPPLPFENASMDVIYSISVFTHLSEALHYSWMAELKRVLRPGGLLLITLHGNCVRHKLSGVERADFDAGGLVVRGRVAEGSRLFAAFHPDAFVRQLCDGLEFVEKREPFAERMEQTLWVMRKPETETR